MSITAFMINLESKKIVNYVILDTINDVPPTNHIFYEIPTMTALDGTIFQPDVNFYDYQWNNNKKCFVDDKNNVIEITFNFIDTYNKFVLENQKHKEIINSTDKVEPEIF
jgi:hypothetical protein